MEIHRDLNLTDIEDVNKIIVNEDILTQMNKYFILNYDFSSIDYTFGSINIEIHYLQKLNIFIENVDEEMSVITLFSNGEKLISCIVERVFDIFFEIHEIFKYEELSKYKQKAEEIVLFVLKWYPIILFYIQSYSVISSIKMKKNKYTKQ